MGKQMETAASTGGKSFTTRGLLGKKPSPLTVPIRPVDPDGEGLVIGFRQGMLTMGKDGKAGEVNTGVGTDIIELRWGDRQVVLRGSEILRAWVATFSQEDADNFPDDIDIIEGTFTVADDA